MVKWSNYLFVVYEGCEGEYARLRIEGEHVVAPVRDDGVRHVSVRVLVSVPRRNLADLATDYRVSHQLADLQATDYRVSHLLVGLATDYRVSHPLADLATDYRVSHNLADLATEYRVSEIKNLKYLKMCVGLGWLKWPALTLT